MKKLILGILLSSSLVATSSAQIVLDDFNAGATTGEGTFIDGTSWIGQVTQNATSIMIGGTARDDNGWGIVGIGADGSAFDQVTLVGQLESGNLATSFTVEFLDGSFATKVVSVPMSSFSLGSLSTVVIPIAWTNFDPTQIIGWSLGGGVPPTGSLAFRLTLDSFSLTSSAAAIPEPSTYAAIFGALALGFVAYRRRMVRAA